MSTEQSEAFKEVANSPGETTQVDITQQATTPTPTTAPRAKNPKRVAAGKAVAERTRLAREQQKKAAAEAAIIIANNKAKGSNSVADPPVSEPDPPIADETPKSNKVDNSSLNITQWIGVAGIVVSLMGIYYKREELKAVFSKKNTPERGASATELLPTPHQPADINRVDVLQPVRTTHKGCGVKPHIRGVKHLD